MLLCVLERLLALDFNPFLIDNFMADQPSSNSVCDAKVQIDSCSDSRSVVLIIEFFFFFSEFPRENIHRRRGSKHHIEP